MASVTLGEGSTLQGGKYHIVKVLGQGGFGITYLAEQVLLKRKIAIKEFFMGIYCARDENSKVYTLTQAELVDRYRQKFFKEAQIIAQQNHPGIVKVIDIFEENATFYYVMEYVEGDSLKTIVDRKGRLPEQVALRYVLKVAEALDYLHKSKINHLDIKPANIMVRREDDMPILIDFGVSKQYDEKNVEMSTTPPGVSLGYSPSEQYKRGGVSKFSPKADIYALGATLYKLLTGKTPPEASDVANYGLPPLPAYISESVKNAIEKAMKFLIVERPKSVKEFVGMLKMEETTVVEKPMVEEDDEITVLPPGDDFLPIKEKGKRLTPSPNAIIGNLINNMVYVEGGLFTMGSATNKGFWEKMADEADSDERPAHQVTLSSFSIGRYEVTQEEWEAVMGENPSKFKGKKKCPVENVSWDDCQVFIKKLNMMTGKNFRLPTEAEWEFAARGGINSKGYKYAGGDDIDVIAWYAGNSGDTTHPVGLKSPNELGLYDMSGNVYEWCEDWYGPYSSSAQKDPKGPSSGSNRVFRGGSLCHYARYCRVAFRFSHTPGYRNNGLGFRLAL